MHDYFQWDGVHAYISVVQEILNHMKQIHVSGHKLILLAFTEKY